MLFDNQSPDQPAALTHVIASTNALNLRDQDEQADRQTIRTVNSPASAGKTYSLVRHVQKLVRDYDQKVIIAAPSVALIDQTHNDFMELDDTLPVKRITNVTDEHVVKAIMAHAGKPRSPDDGEVLIVSHSGLLMTPNFANKSDWFLYCDEAMAAHDCIRIADALPDHVLKALHVQQHDAEYSIITAKIESRLRTITKRQPDHPHAKYRDLAQAIMSKAHDVFVKTSAWEANDGIAAFKSLRHDALQGWGSVTVMSALMPLTMMHALWDAKTRWVPNKAISDNLRYQSHTNGHRLRILYASPRDWSKRLRDRVMGSTTPLMEIVRAAQRESEGQEFGVMVNKDIEEIVGGMEGAVLIPALAHGLNKFQHLNAYLCVAALNLPPDHHLWLESRGLSPEQIRAGTFLSALYQSVMRTSLRDPAAVAPVTVIVPDEGSARFLASIFDGAQIDRLQTDVAFPDVALGGRPRVHVDASAKGLADAAHASWNRHRAKRELIDEMSKLIPAQICDAKPIWNPLRGFASQNHAGIALDEPNADLAGGAPPIQKKCAVSAPPVAGFHLFASKYDLIASDLLPYTGPDAFIGLLHSYATRVLKDKTRNMLISPSVFDPDQDSETSKGRRNVVYASAIWLDFDGGDLRHDDFARIFPKWRVLVYSTYSSTKAVPRFRIFLPTSHVMSVRAYMLICSKIIKALEHEGYRDAEYIRKSKSTNHKDHGLDKSKQYPENLLYMPAMPKDPDGFIWQDYKDDGREPIPVVDLLANSSIDVVPEEMIAAPMPTFTTPEIAAHCKTAMRNIAQKLRDANSARAMKARQAFVDAAVSEWRSNRAGRSNAEFFRLAGALIKADIHSSELGTILHHEAAFCKSTSDRRKDIPRMLKYLRSRI